MQKKTKFLLALLSCAVFLCLIVLLLGTDVAPIGPMDTEVGLSGLNGSVAKALGENDALYKLTQVTGYSALLLAAVAAGFGLYQWIHRKSLKLVDRDILILAGLYVAVAVVYVLFEKVVINYRPVLMEGETFPEASFPSSHTMLAMTIYGSAAILVRRYLKPGTLRNVLTVCLVALAAITVCGRLLSGVHWASDILGGVLISTALLFAFSGLLPANGQTAPREELKETGDGED